MAIDKLLNTFENELEAVGRRLVSLTSAAIGKSDVAGAVDAVRARVQVQELLNQAGYNGWVDNLMTKGYQEIVNDSFKVFKKEFGEELLFSSKSLQELNAMKQLDFSNYASLADDAQTELSRVIINRQFGAITESQALEQIQGVIDNSLMRYSKTWLNTASRNFSNKVNIKMGEDAGLEYYVYRGPIDDVTRQFGLDYIGMVGTIAEWDALENDAPKPVSEWLTGWNHRGVLRPISAKRAAELPHIA